MTITTEEAEECARGQDSIKESSQFPGYRSIACRAAATIRSLAAKREALQARVAELEGALRELIDHTHDCEKDLTKKLHHVDFCGESLPLTNARAALKGKKDE